MKVLTLVVEAPQRYRVPTSLQVQFPDRVCEQKVRTAVRSRLPSSITLIDYEILVFTLNGDKRPPTPSFIRVQSIVIKELDLVEFNAEDGIMSDGRMLRFMTRDGKSHVLPFSGTSSEFLDLLGWCNANTRYVICHASDDNASYPHYMVEVGWVGKFPREDRPSSPPMECCDREASALTSAR